MGQVKDEVCFEGGMGDEWLKSFFFQQRHGRLNVRKLARLDLHEVVEKVDIAALQDVLENVAFCNLKVKDLQDLSDGIIVKTFRVAQLIVEYLINLENALFNENDRIKKEVEVLKRDIDQLLEDNKLIADENDLLRKDIKQKRKALATFEYVLTVHGPSGSAGVKDLLVNTLKGFRGGQSLEACVCQSCGKTFSSREFLARHCSRRNHIMPKRFEDRENMNPNVETGKIDAEELLERLEQTIETREEQIQSAVAHARALERKLYEEQLSVLRSDRREHEQRLEAHYKSQLQEQRVSYEQRIATLEAKLEMYQSNAFMTAGFSSSRQQTTTITSSELEKTSNERQHDEKKELEINKYVKKLEREVALLRNSSPKAKASASTSPVSARSSGGPGRDLMSSLNTNDTSEEQLQLHDKDYKLRKVVMENFARLIGTVIKAKARLKISRAFAKWRLYGLGLVFTKTKVALMQAQEREKERPSYKVSVAEHVAKFADSGFEHTPATEDMVRKITMKFLHAEKERNITESDRKNMDKVDQLIDTNASFVASQFKLEPQPLDYAPIKSKPYVRARWEHRPSEIRTQLESIEQQLAEKMARYDPSTPGMNALSDVHHAKLMEQVKVAHKNHPDKHWKRALKAVNQLVGDLTKAYYHPDSDAYDDIFFQDELTYQDPLLQAALVPINERRQAPRRDVDTETASMHTESVSERTQFSEEETQLQQDFDYDNDDDDEKQPNDQLPPMIDVEQTILGEDELEEDDEEVRQRTTFESKIQQSVGSPLEYSPLPPPPSIGEHVSPKPGGVIESTSSSLPSPPSQKEDGSFKESTTLTNDSNLEEKSNEATLQRHPSWGASPIKQHSPKTVRYEPLMPVEEAISPSMERERNISPQSRGTTPPPLRSRMRDDELKRPGRENTSPSSLVDDTQSLRKQDSPKEPAPSPPQEKQHVSPIPSPNEDVVPSPRREQQNIPSPLSETATQGNAQMPSPPNEPRPKDQPGLVSRFNPTTDLETSETVEQMKQLSEEEFQQYEWDYEETFPKTDRQS